MRNVLRGLQQFLRDEDGPTAVEYAVMLAFIIIVCIAIVTQLGTSVSSAFNSANGAFS
jgi:pilus assembly protein Flp/PilA